MSGFQKDSRGRIFAVAWPTEGSKSTKISHRWNDKTTWSQEAAAYAEQLASVVAVGVDYDLPHLNIIDCYHGKIWDEDSLAMRVLVEVDEGAGWTSKTEVDPHTEIGDFTLDYATGRVTFSPAIDVGSIVRATYHVANSSVYTVKPEAGKRLSIQSAEVQFAADTVMTDTVHFELWGLVDAFAPQLLDTATPPGPYPSGTLIRLKRTSYKTLAQFIDESNGSNPTIPAIGGPGWRSLSQPVTVFPWNYQAIMSLDSSLGMEIRINLEHDEPFGGAYSTCTMYCLSEDEIAP